MTDSDSIDLFTRTVGDGERRVVFLHGLFGRGKNFTRIAKGLEPECTSLLVDLPNHGRSDWTEEFDYRAMADHVAATLRADFAAAGPVDVIGHSMGGKVAMVLALRHPELVDRLVVEDISPVGTEAAKSRDAESDDAESAGADDAGSGGSEFDHLLSSLRALDLGSVTDRAAADEALSESIPTRTVRGFLLQNLRSGDDGLFWEPNLELLHASLPVIGGFPELGDARFDHPVLWVGGTRSDYIRPEYGEAMRALFPRTTRMMIKDAGHWLHSEKPEEFIAVLRGFLLDDRD